jgi:lysozyme
MSPGRIACVLPILLLLAPLLLFGAWQGFLRFEPDRGRYPVRGIDVSHHQGLIDWRAVAADDVAFAYLKASEGGDHRDSEFSRNWQAAREAGLAVGAYHYFTLCRTGADQARNFLAATPEAADALPPVVDLEFGGNCGERPDGAALKRELEAFLAPVEQRAGRPAILYMTDEFRRAYGGVLPDRPQWRRSIVLKPSGGPVWTIWQFHNRGRVAGIQGPVDLNVFKGDRAAFDRWRRR